MWNIFSYGFGNFFMIIITNQQNIIMSFVNMEITSSNIIKCHMPCFVFCASRAWPCKWLRLSTRKPIRSCLSGCVKPNMTLQVPGIAVNDLEPSQESPLSFLENFYCWGKWWRTIPFKVSELTPNAMPIWRTDTNHSSFICIVFTLQSPNFMHSSIFYLYWIFLR